ncbi:transcriptional corepressor LEUNIG_HOMOLOG-like [Vicia villosa]|uniref:transcriptional corepressor LEUNIG_HOMOLOG-like n=1 Tax=Vicia villosa TaxID=3911 RepID=UPI00273CC125|nr:transcriptional corepressor LEUNIG_HOMOLOG-like [Vicia villosa]
MEPKLHNEEIFQKFLYAYLMENGYQRTAKLFQTETQITDPMPDEPPGFLLDFWNIFYEMYNSRPSLHMEQTSPQNQVIVQQPSNTSTQSQVIVQQPSNASTQSQVIVQEPSNTSTQNQVLVQQPLNIGPVINTTIWDETPIQYHSSFESGAKLLSCDISSDGKIVASVGKKIGRKPFICYTETRRSVTTQDKHRETITEVRFQQDSNLFATASVDTTVKLWNATTLSYTKHEKGLRHRGTVRSLDFHPLHENTLCSSDDTAIKVWDLNKYIKANWIKEGGRVVRVRPVSGNLLAVAKGNDITLIDYPNLFVTNKLQGHVKAINSMCWDVTGEMIASVSEDEVRVWSVSEGRCIHSCPAKGRKFQTVIFHPRYHMSLVIGGHRCLLLLNLESKREYTTPYATELSITGLAAATKAQAQSQFIVSASDDSVVKIWK